MLKEHMEELYAVQLLTDGPLSLLGLSAVEASDHHPRLPAGGTTQLQDSRTKSITCFV